MEDVLYRRNVMAERACPVCGTDRRAGRRSKTADCDVCGAPLVAQEAFVRVHLLGAKAACSVACLRRIPANGGPESLACPWCGARWPGMDLPVRACGTCGTPLRAEAGHVALVRAGRIRTFCDPSCLTTHLARPNPFCG